MQFRTFDYQIAMPNNNMTSHIHSNKLLASYKRSGSRESSTLSYFLRENSEFSTKCRDSLKFRPTRPFSGLILFFWKLTYIYSLCSQYDCSFRCCSVSTSFPSLSLSKNHITTYVIGVHKTMGGFCFMNLSMMWLIVTVLTRVELVKPGNDKY